MWADLKHPRSLARFLYAQRVVGLQPSNSIGLDAQAEELFRGLLRKSAGYLEFGSGGSTLEAAKLEVRTLSVEADRFFAAAVRRALPPASSVEVMDIDIGLTREWSRPVFTKKTQRRVRRWQNYATAPFRRLEELGWFPDLVLIDGRFRRACALQSAKQALNRGRVATLIVDDYFDPLRTHYHALERWLGRPRKVGRAALFEVREGVTAEPSVDEISEAVLDFE